MKHTLLGLAATLALATGLNAEYPRDAAERFKMKFGIEHPVVTQEAREKLEAQNLQPRASDSKLASAGNCGGNACEGNAPISR